FAPDFANLQVTLICIQVEWRLVEGFAFTGGQLHHFIIKPGNSNAALVIVKGSDHPTKNIDRVGYSTAIDPGMEVAVRAGNLDLHIAEAAETYGYGRMIQ